MLSEQKHLILLSTHAFLTWLLIGAIHDKVIQVTNEMFMSILFKGVEKLHFPDLPNQS